MASKDFPSAWLKITSDQQFLATSIRTSKTSVLILTLLMLNTTRFMSEEQAAIISSTSPELPSTQQRLQLTRTQTFLSWNSGLILVFTISKSEPFWKHVFCSCQYSRITGHETSLLPSVDWTISTLHELLCNTYQLTVTGLLEYSSRTSPL
ncbi:unnamed protein product [Spodoptera exigua]|nr:unnamed protein product [Spodoptera exigua]